MHMVFPRSSGENITIGQGAVMHSRPGAAKQNSNGKKLENDLQWVVASERD